MSPRGKKTSRPHRRRLEVAAAVTLAVALGPILSGVFMVASGSADRIYTAGEDVPARGVIMVLGARADPGCPSGLLTTRLNVAVDLFKLGRGKVILVTGTNTAESNYKTQVMEDHLISWGTPAGRIMQDIAGHDTYDSCTRARDVFGVREMTAVSQVYHLLRTITTCRALGVNVIGVGDVTAQRNWPEHYLQEELCEFLAYVKMQLDPLRGAKVTQSPSSNAIQDALRRSQVETTPLTSVEPGREGWATRVEIPAPK